MTTILMIPGASGKKTAKKTSRDSNSEKGGKISRNDAMIFCYKSAWEKQMYYSKLLPPEKEQLFSCLKDLSNSPYPPLADLAANTLCEQIAEAICSYVTNRRITSVQEISDKIEQTTNNTDQQKMIIASLYSKLLKIETIEKASLYNVMAGVTTNLAINAYNCGRAEDAVGDHRNAIEKFNEAIELDPKQVEFYFYRATAKEQSGDVKGAKEDLLKACRLDPSMIERVEAYKNEKALDKEPEKPIKLLDQIDTLTHKIWLKLKKPLF